MNAKLEERIEYAKRAVPAVLFLGLLGLGLFKGVGELIMQPKRQQARMAAYERALKSYNPNHLIRMGDEVNGNVIDTVSETADLMPVYAVIGGKNVLVPLDKRIEYVANLNGISKESGYDVKPETVLEY